MCGGARTVMHATVMQALTEIYALVVSREAGTRAKIEMRGAGRAHRAIRVKQIEGARRGNLWT